MADILGSVERDQHVEMLGSSHQTIYGQMLQAALGVGHGISLLESGFSWGGW